MADDGEDALRTDDADRRRDYMIQQWPPTHLMENLRAPGFQARALARGHDNDGERRTSLLAALCLAHCLLS
jgi:hypothetical protein